MVEEHAVELTKLMQDAAFDPTRWEPALNAVNKFVGGTGAVLLSIEARQRFAPCSSDLSEMMDDYYSNGWYMNDRREACVSLLKENGIVFDQDFQSVEDIVNCDYYHDFLARHRQKWFAGIGVKIDSDYWCLALQRSPKTGPFTVDDMAALTFVRAALSNTAHLSRQAGHAWMFGLQHALDAMGQAAIVFDNRARVLKINDAAIAIVGSSIDTQKNISFDSARTGALFSGMLKKALSPLTLSAKTDPVVTIHLKGNTFSCRAISLLGQEALLATSAAALVVMSPIVKSPTTILKGRYGLTDAEVRVAIAIADGNSVEEIAFDNHVAVGTIRGQTKSIFSKTGINKQSKLVAFVRNLAVDRAQS